MNQVNSKSYSMIELEKESHMGANGTEIHQEVPVIDLSNFEVRKYEIADEIWKAATEIGFFQVKNHGIALGDIDQAFDLAKQFFTLPLDIKKKYPLKRNAGWESKAQIRPSTQTADQKESYQITLSRMEGLWPTQQELPDFKINILEFEKQCWKLGMQILSCFAYKLGFPEDFFTVAHDPTKAEYQSTLRMLHYYAVDPSVAGRSDLWRAGAHTDFDCLTLLFQREGQGGLQVCPGKDIEAQTWTNVQPFDDIITCNIGDMLMRWSDDILLSNFHRVKIPSSKEALNARYSIAFFCQANEDIIIESPRKKYPSITAKEYLKQRISANFSGKY